MATANPYLGVDNPYLTATIDKAQGDLTRNYNLTAQPAFNAAMVNSGSFGNAGVQQMNENSQRNLQGSLGNISTQLRGADYANQANLYMQQQAADRTGSQWDQQFAANQAQQGVQNNQWNQQFGAAQNQLGVQNNQWNQQFGTANDQWNQQFNRQVYNDGVSQNNQNLQTGIGLLGTLNGYQQQNLTNGTNIQNTPLNYWQQFSQGANSLGQGYGSTTGTTGTSSNPALSAIGGAQLGMQAMNAWNGSGNISQSNQNAFDSYGANNGWWGTT
jgi:hypothetical protein